MVLHHQCAKHGHHNVNINTHTPTWHHYSSIIRALAPSNTRWGQGQRCPLFVHAHTHTYTHTHTLSFFLNRVLNMVTYLAGWVFAFSRARRSRVDRAPVRPTYIVVEIASQLYYNRLINESLALDCETERSGGGGGNSYSLILFKCSIAFLPYLGGLKIEHGPPTPSM